MIITYKRIIAVFFAYSIFAVAIVFRIAAINQSVSEQAAFQSNTRLLTVGQTRGMIYDRNMKPLVNRTAHTVLAVNPTNAAMSVLKDELTQSDYEQARKKAESGKPFLFVCDYYSGDCEDIIVTVTYDRYSDADVATHLIGYLDAEGYGVSGIENAFDSLLSEHSGSFSVRYTADAYGRSLSGMGLEEVDLNYDSQGGIVLTIDSVLQRLCENVMKWNGLDKGAVVVLDAATSEILAMASAPVYDRNALGASLTDENQPFFNRALAAYPVGSVFKPIVAAAALENGTETDLFFACNGYADASGVRFNCHNRAGHGMLDMVHAMAVSCNAYFINLGIDTGKNHIISLAESLGFGAETELCEGIVSSAGNLPDSRAIDSTAALANLSFGQGELLATPLQIAAAYCAFANGGYYNQPHLLKYMLDNDGEIVAYYKNEVSNKVITDSVCKKIVRMLEYTVEEGSGRLAAPMMGSAAGKTATAETGRTENGMEKVHTWFAGIYKSDKKDYVIVVFRENGNSSSTDCAPVFRDIADGIAGKK